MTNIVATIATSKMDFPSGVTAAGPFDWALFAVGTSTPVATQQTDGATLTATFPSVAPGDYTVAARRLAADGTTQISPAVTSVVITVPQPTAQFDAPASISVVLG